MLNGLVIDVIFRAYTFDVQPVQLVLAVQRIQLVLDLVDLLVVLVQLLLLRRVNCHEWPHVASGLASLSYLVSDSGSMYAPPCS